MSARSAFRWALAGTLLLLLPVVCADNCSGPSDCEQTADYNNGIAIGGGIVAIITSIVVTTFGPPGTGPVLMPPGSGPPLDPFTNKPLTVNDGQWPDVPPGSVWWPWGGGGWRSRKDVDDLIRKRNDDLQKEKDWKAKEDQRNDETWEKNKEWSEKGTKDIGKKRQDEADEEARQRRAEEEAERKRKRREELVDRQERNKKERADADSWQHIKEDFWDKTTKEVDDLPRDLQNLGRDVVRGTFAGGRDLAKGLADPENWRIGIETLGGTIHDVITDPIKLLTGDKDAWDRHYNNYDTATKVVGHVVEEIKKDPVEFVKGLTPIKAWEDAMDPNKPLIERIGRTWWATIDTALTVEGIGKALGKGGVKTIGEVAVDDATDAARRALRERKLPPGVTPEELKELNEAWERRRMASRGKVFDYETKARELDDARKLGDAKEIERAAQAKRDAAMKLQADKMSLQELNRGKQSTIKNFNGDMKHVYGNTDDKMVDWAGRENGFGKLEPHGTGPDGERIFRDAKGNEVHIAEPTNPTGGKVKAGADRDYTMRAKPAGANEAKDIPSGQVQDEYNKHFFDSAGGKDMAKRTGLPEDPGHFTEKMDQVATDKLHKEAYGSGPRDLETALKKPGQAFSDPNQVGKAIEYKGDHWTNKGDFYEGSRQTMKQFDNQALGRFKAMDQHVEELQKAGQLPKDFALKPPSPQVSEGVEILRKVHQPNGISPMQAEEELRKIGMTPQDVSRGVGDYVDSLQRAAPPILRQRMGGA
jgi:hypothetical protein